jgi:SpoVK/Ycf46/Vps4 family AAA+-type ATPase
VGNLDPAFERRFLFKVEFHKPDAASRAKIWKSMIGSLSEADATTLAGRYEFSGGNIENVVRKSSVEYVLTGQQPTVDTLSTFCEEETYAKAERKRIGF